MQKKETERSIPDKIEPGEWRGRLIKQPDESTMRPRFKDKILYVIGRVAINRVKI